jgi:hypothetical protein
VQLPLTKSFLTLPVCFSQSVLRRDAREAVSLEFVLSPVDRSDLDWSLAATCAPCHITIWRASVDRVLDFFQAGRAASPSAVQDTAAALQVGFTLVCVAYCKTG